MTKVSPLRSVYGEAIYGVSRYDEDHTNLIEDGNGYHNARDVIDKAAALYEDLFKTYPL